MERRRWGNEVRKEEKNKKGYKIRIY